MQRHRISITDICMNLFIYRFDNSFVRRTVNDAFPFIYLSQNSPVVDQLRPKTSQICLDVPCVHAKSVKKKVSKTVAKLTCTGLSGTRTRMIIMQLLFCHVSIITKLSSRYILTYYRRLMLLHFQKPA